MEITASELRIGNVVRYELQQCNYALSIRDVLWCLEDNYAFNKTFTPVLLDKEILLKFGFHKLCNEFSYKGTCFEKYKNEFFYSAGEGLKLSINIKYLHQLQNLYFALTGKELNTTGL